MASIGPGSQLDRYAIVALVAEGGMGSVWRARLCGRHGFERTVALKTMLPDLATSPRFRAMLLDEARVAALVEHPNVVQVLDLGEHDDILYLVMEWVEGTTLHALTASFEERGARLPLGAVLRLVGDAARGLHAAHELRDELGRELQLVHRDVSPDNVLVSTAGFARLTDFGIAKARQRLSAETTAGRFKGKPGYASPEQAAALPVDRTSDVWSLGAILHRLLAGAPPFVDPAALVAYVHGIADCPPLPDDTPPALVAIVRRALAPAPGDRFPTALTVERALGEVEAASGGAWTSNQIAALVQETRATAPPPDTIVDESAAPPSRSR
jgi:eukaryotic-like serine/threonine-protein kinase